MKRISAKISKPLCILFVITVINPVFILTILFILLLSLPFRSLVWLLSRVFRPDLSGFVPPDQACFALGQAHNFPLNVAACAIVEGHLDVKYFWGTVSEKVFPLRTSSGKIVYIGLKRYWTLFLGYAFWKEDGSFSVKNHVRFYDYTGALALPLPYCDDAGMHQILGRLLRFPWRPNRSPWEMLLIPNYKGEEKTALIFRLDHVLADGYSVVELMRHIMQNHWPLPKFKLARRQVKFLEKLGTILKIQYDIARKAVMFYGTKKIPSLKRSGDLEVVFSVTSEIPVDAFKSLKNHFGVNYAAVVNACIFGAIQRALEKAAQVVPNKFLTSVVIPKLNHPGGLCIHAGVTFTEWPLKSTSSVQRLLDVQKGLEDLNQSSANLIYMQAGKVTGFFPQFVSTLVFKGINASGVNIGTTVLPVTTGKSFINGMEMSELIVGNGIVGDFDMLVTSFGVNNKQRVSFSVNKDMFGDEAIARNLGLFFMEEVETLLKAMQQK
ncbi:unnamed protein product [Allacma fusca]|uniref:diacylglycerol O-acyltransferase n=1 Tax=Allacma fusca TaxID=39272 RepID=A0A8J2P9M9_9HEXA|nr:unnamed protein product [Allacma fusca]